MDIELNTMSTVPIYQQLRDRIVEAIGCGALRQGDALVSVRQLGASFGINPATASKAYDLLRAEGLVVTNAKSGTLITADRDSMPASEEFTADFRARLFTLLAEGRARGLSDADLRSVCAQAAHRLASPAEER